VLQLERKRSEEQALLLDNIETQIWYLTDTETYGIVNKAHAAFLGMEKEKLEGRVLYDVISVEEAEVCIANNREVFEKKKQSHTEERVKNGRGETRLLSITRTPKLDGEGDVEYVICAAEDITELKKAEERIEHLNSVLKAIRKVNQLIIVEKDRDSLLQKACNALVDARGYDAAWLGFLSDGKNFATVVGSGFGEDVARFCEHVMGGDHPPCIRNALAHKDPFMVVDRSRVCGDCFFKSACAGNEAAIIRVEHANKFFGLLAILFAPDVTVDEEEKELLDEVAGDTSFALHDMEVEEARKQAEEKLRNAEADWRNSFNSLDDVMLIINRDYNIENINEIGLKLLGKSKEEVIGKKCYQVISGADSPGEDCPCTKSLETKKVESCDRYEERFGKYYAIRTSPIFDDNGAIIKFVDLRRDITERKQAEKRIEHLNSVLKAIRKVNQLITMEKDRNRLLQGACDNLIATRGYYNAWIALIDESGSLVTTAEAGLGKDFLPLVERLKRGELTDCGRKALMQLQVVATEDPFSTCTDCPLSDKYHDRGALTVRLEYGEKVYGLLSVSIPKELTADKEEQNLFKEVVGDLAFALYRIGLEEEQKRAEDKVKEAYRLREHFLKETSHRIITPVAIIGGNTDLLLESSNLDDNQKEKIRIIRERNEEVQKLVRDALVGKYLEEEEGGEG
jgi:PAS domain S-box-containing protein